MVAVDRDRAEARSIPNLGESLLPLAAIYGPNASGKTNIVAALTWLYAAVRDSLRFWDDEIPIEPFTRRRPGQAVSVHHRVRHLRCAVRVRCRARSAGGSLRGFVSLSGEEAAPDLRTRRHRVQAPTWSRQPLRYSRLADGANTGTVHRPTVVIFCEGKASEPDYINGLKRLPNVHGNTSINIEVDSHQGMPLTLVRLAIDRAADDEVNECWCVFDVEWPKNHPNVKQAIQLARDHRIRLAISNPSFELWLILHFEDQAAFLTTDEAERRSRKLDGRSGKKINADEYIPHRCVAARRASSLSCRHERDQTLFPHDNPSSTMSDLLTVISAMEP